MELLLDDGNAVRFGDKLADIEHLLSSQAIDDASPIARKSIDKLIQNSNVSLSFDSGLLKGIRFMEDYQFVNPPTPYPEPWKNFPIIGLKKIFSRMSRDDFLTYLAAWEERAKQFGADKVDFGDLTSQQFEVSIDQDKFWDHIYINMGPSRRAGGGGIWCDGWGVTFSMVGRGRQTLGIKAGLLENLSAFRDEFNTVARKR